MDGDIDRKSLLDLLRHKERPQIARTLIIGELAKDVDRVEYSTYFQRFFKKHQTENELITGILLIYKNHYLHLLESSLKLMTLFLNDSNVSHTTTNDRILLFQDDQQARFYPFWASRMIDIKQDQELDKQSLQDPEQCSKILGDLSIGILSIGKQLTNVSKQEAKKIFDEFSDKFRKELPPSGTISSLAQFRGIMSIDEFIQQQGYSKTRLESEVVWPAPTIISV